MNGSEAVGLQALFWIVLGGLVAVLTAIVLLIRSGHTVPGEMLGGTPPGPSTSERLVPRARSPRAPPRHPASAAAVTAGRSSSSEGTRTRNRAGSTPK